MPISIRRIWPLPPTRVEQWCAVWENVSAGLPPDGDLGVIGRLHDVKQSIDRQLDNVLSLRVQFAACPTIVPGTRRCAIICEAPSILTELSGRLRSIMVDVVDRAADRYSQQLMYRERLIDLLKQKHSSPGAQIMSVDLFKPRSPTESGEVPPPLPAPLKLKVIQLISEAGTADEIDELADFLLDSTTPPTQVLAAAEAIRALGLPQDFRSRRSRPRNCTSEYRRSILTSGNPTSNRALRQCWHGLPPGTNMGSRKTRIA